MKVCLSLSKNCAICNLSPGCEQLIGLYVVGTQGALAYLMCARCGDRAGSGLPRDERIAFEKKLERAADQLGLTAQPQGGKS